jgi:hypothetical protein
MYRRNWGAPGSLRCKKATQSIRQIVTGILCSVCQSARAPLLSIHIHVFFCGAATQRGSWPPHSRGFLDHTQRRTTIGRTSLEEWSARPRDLYLATQNTHNREISMTWWDSNPGEGPQTYALDRAATGTGEYIRIHIQPNIFSLTRAYSRLLASIWWQNQG